MNPLIPQVIAAVLEYRNDITNFFFGEDEELPVKKKRDNRKITQTQYDYIVSSYKTWMGNNKPFPKYELVNQINAALKLDKCMTVYSRIWNGEKKREDFSK